MNFVYSRTSAPFIGVATPQFETLCFSKINSIRCIESNYRAYNQAKKATATMI